MLLTSHSIWLSSELSSSTSLSELVASVSLLLYRSFCLGERSPSSRLHANRSIAGRQRGTWNKVPGRSQPPKLFCMPAYASGASSWPAGSAASIGRKPDGRTTPLHHPD